MHVNVRMGGRLPTAGITPHQPNARSSIIAVNPNISVAATTMPIMPRIFQNRVIVRPPVELVPYYLPYALWSHNATGGGWVPLFGTPSDQHPGHQQEQKDEER